MAADENFSRAMTNVITEDMEVFMEEEVGQKIVFLTELLCELQSGRDIKVGDQLAEKCGHFLGDFYQLDDCNVRN